MAHMSTTPVFGTIIKSGAFGAPFMVTGSSEEGCYHKVEWFPVKVPAVDSEGSVVKWSERRSINGSPTNPNGDKPASNIEVRLRGKVKTTCVCVSKENAVAGGNILPLEREGLGHGSGLSSDGGDGGQEYKGVVAFKYVPANGVCPEGPDGKCKGGPKYKNINKTYPSGGGYSPTDFKGAGGNCLAGEAGCTAESWRNFQNKYGEPESGPGGIIIQSMGSGLGTSDAGYALARAALAKAISKALEEGITQIDCNLGIVEPEDV